MKNKYTQVFLIMTALLVFNSYANNSYASPFDESDISSSIQSASDDSLKAGSNEIKASSTEKKSGFFSSIGEKIKFNVGTAQNAISNGYDSVKSGVSSLLSKKKGYINESIFLPGHESKEMVCQGIAYLPTKVVKADEQGDGSYCQYVLLSYYPKKSEQPSQIVVVDRKTAKPVKRFALYKSEDKAYTGHAGGIAVAGKYLWVASGNKIFGFDVQTIIDFIGDTKTEAKAVDGLPKSMDKLPAKKLIATKTYSVDSKASYVSFDGKYIWVGDFTKSSAKDYKPVKHHKILDKNCWIAGYLVDSDGHPTSETEYTYTSGDDKYTVHKPDAVIAMRESVQGMAVCGKYVALSVSYGATNSKLAFYNNPLKTDSKKLTYKPEGQSNSFTVDAWKLADGLNWVKTVKLAAGAEDMEYDGENLYVTFECSSKNYKTKWSLNPLVKITNDFYLIDPEKAAEK